MGTRLLLAAIATTALCTGVLAAVIGAADLVADDARETLERWRMDGRVGGGDGWNSVNRRLRTARDLAPRDAGHRAARAEVFTWWLAAAPPDPGRRLQVVDAARSEQLAAIARRPTWAMAWARLGEIDYLAGRDAPVIWPSLVEASRLGPWEPGVHLITVRVGMGLWERLDAEQRLIVERAARRSLRSDSNLLSLAMLAVHHDRVEWLASLSDNADYRRELSGRLANAAR